MVIVVKKKTIKDVAELANVSISTVSNALNGVNVVTPETKQRVLKAAAELNYVPNLMGKQLRSGETKMLGFFTDSVSGPYFYVLVEAISRAVAKLGYGMQVIVPSDHKTLMNNILGNVVDGAIIFEHMINDDDIQQILMHSVPTVLLDRPAHGPKMSSFIFNSQAEGYEATKYLLNLGHRRLGFLAGYENNHDSHLRYAGFKQAIEEAGLNSDEMPVLSGLFEEEASYNAVKSYLHYADEPATAFLAGNDLSAIGAMKAIVSLGYKVAEDFSVMGFDDIEISQYFRPALTTVRNPIARQGILAVDELLAMINGRVGGTEQVLDGELVIRDSTGFAKH